MFAAGIGALDRASALIPPETVRQAVIAEIRNVTGLEPTIRGDVTVSLFPTAMVSFSDVMLGDEHAAPALAADRLTAKLQLLPLLVGRIEPADMSLTRPRIDRHGRAGRPLELVRPDGDARAHARSRARQRREHVLSFSEIRMSERHHHDHRRSARRFRRTFERRAVVRLAVDLAQLRRDRPLRLA